MFIIFIHKIICQYGSLTKILKYIYNNIIYNKYNIYILLLLDSVVKEMKSINYIDDILEPIKITYYKGNKVIFVFRSFKE